MMIMKLKTLNFDTVVIGCGVAGMTAALYLKRANVRVCIIEKNAPGGQLNKITEIENYPGFKSIDGPTFAFNIFNQIRSLDITYKYLNVLEIISKDDYKIVKTNKEEINCKNVVIETGRISRELGLSNEKKLLSNGVSYCAICDGTLYKDKIVCVVGGGNSALESAMYLSYICSKVYLIHRNDEYRAEGILVDKLLQKSNIECIKNARITELKETNDKLSSVVINNDKEIICDGIFIEIGNVPVPIKCDGLKLDDNYIVVDSSMKTSVDGVYACGDIIKKEVYQISTAVGEGTMAAVSIIRS